MPNLYHIKRKSYGGYDTYSDAVVCANTADEAKLIHPSEANEDLEWYKKREDENDPFYNDSWVWPEDIVVQLIGAADSSVELNSVICASFHAG